MYKVSLTAQLCIFGAVFLLGFIAVAACNTLLIGIISDERTRMLIISTLQGLIVFCLPSFVATAFSGKNCFKILSLDINPGFKAIVGVIIAYALGFILLNQIVYWNDSITLPSSMKDLELLFRKMEDAARDTAGSILSDTSIGGLITSLLVVGVITGFSEELFFRGALQKLLYGAINKHVAIWLTAFIFSFMHFQFFGFIPRVLVGAFFGYLFLWTGSIWTSIFAHTLNNSVVVISEWLIARHIVNSDIDSIGITKYGFPLPALISFILFTIFLLSRRYWFNSAYKKINK